MFDLDGNRVAEYNADTGALLAEYVWLNGRPIAAISGGVVYYVRSDHIGRPAFATDGTGAIVWDASYRPFGGVQASTGAPINLRFPGQWFSSESDLNQNWMRDYDPTLGRYIQADPLGLVDGASIYGYALQSPNRHTDFRGENALKPIAGALAAGSTNAALQFGIGYIWGDMSAKQALKCIDISKVIGAGAFGAIGASTVNVLKTGGGIIRAGGLGALASYVNYSTGTVRVEGVDCECKTVKIPAWLRALVL